MPLVAVAVIADPDHRALHPSGSPSEHGLRNQRAHRHLPGYRFEHTDCAGLCRADVSLGIAFQVFTLILLPTLLFLGAATFGRVLESSIEDYFYLGGINRIHHFYVEAASEISGYFVLSPYDDAGVCRAWGS